MPPEGTPLVRLEARDAEALFEGAGAPVYPHTGRQLNPRVASYLEGSTRAERRSGSVELLVTLRSPPMTPADEDRVRGELHTYFSEEEQLANLDLRINRTEGLGSFRYGIPWILVALLVAGTFYWWLPTLESQVGAAFASALVYLFFITVVWVMLWDPIEKLLFDGYILRMRLRAVSKLAGAVIRFSYPASPSSAPIH
ncbi:MAG TPA: hypothetical protein VEH57_07085 [Thermoplasmata archaeon]|nr:hypothetical protein [Thermoplasmata archaeon]